MVALKSAARRTATIIKTDLWLRRRKKKRKTGICTKSNCHSLLTLSFLSSSDYRACSRPAPPPPGKHTVCAGMQFSVYSGHNSARGLFPFFPLFPEGKHVLELKRFSCQLGHTKNIIKKNKQKKNPTHQPVPKCFPVHACG